MADYHWPPTDKCNLIGRRISRLDGPWKSSGRIKYSYDLNRPNMLRPCDPRAEVATLQRLNHLVDSSLIYAGADFQVPAASGAPSAVPAATAVRAAARVRALPSSGSTGSLRHAATEVFGAQYRCAAALITRESGWQVHALDPSSGAYGLAQALPGSKMAAAGPDWHDDGGTQLRWMRSYVNSRYGSACAAWAFWQAHSWY